ncbi:uncharacterized protein STEHIDRAFT_124402 [Stereum hirsutum FP-91666 SS1]|uniref:uncharacterized protein n=1 Tax=Stereum hirsutum (strain FP-91666) TaxID=721885 RepID=UPI000444A144|nr:uncharacterized protein STEHIDRAFT_124402 [Stereum hirsutum FP-91666 SS1]EIM83109.1 hypothetical protein STEHIDRAFT_124402 [Stereum hirsutum FP-91666 SS1]
MESKLKALKVVDLKEILSQAQVAFPTNIKKSDLITKILDSPAALDAYSAKYASDTTPASKTPVTPQDDLLAPPESIDWNAEELSETSAPQGTAPSAEPQAPPQPSTSATNTSSTSKQEPTIASASSTSPISNNTGIDEELEKRRSRAARFGIPLVETPTSKTVPPAGKKVSASARQPRSEKSSKPVAPAPPQDTEKLKARAERFGIQTKEPSSNKSNKRVAPAEEVDAEELARRKKRAERFGTGNKVQA